MTDSDYVKYRGKCLEFSKAAVEEDHSLTLTRGWYHCPITNTREQHWWCTRPDGSIHDPTKLQFASKGFGAYEVFNGTITCDNCNKNFKETDPGFQAVGSKVFCSCECYAHFVGF